MPPTLLADEYGEVTNDLVNYYERVSACDVSMVITEPASVKPNEYGFSRQLCGNSQDSVTGLSRVSRVIRKHGVIPILSLFSPGINAAFSGNSSYVFGPSVFTHPKLEKSVRALSYEQIKATSASYLEAAITAWNSGFSGIEISGADGSLIQQFLSPLTNKREDDYGYRFYRGEKLILEIVKAIKKALPDLLCIYKLAMKDLIPCGKPLKDSVELAKNLEKAGIDLLHVTEGFPIGKPEYGEFISKTTPDAPFADDCQIIRNHVKVPLILSGKIATPDLAENLISQGKCDAISLGRTLNRDLDWLVKAKLNSENIRIRKCRRCIFCAAASNGCPDMNGIPFWSINLEHYRSRINQ
ncbi:MAG: NADH:flavin oxidoreductase [Candidatus Rifleibacteriota bacterium]